ncbi:MAG: FAD-dependent oxidoreductase [Solirubrobacterales bacterium]|nr:FAD-dependent oxidoreductase [Solirubrobacterales bacterium]
MAEPLDVVIAGGGIAALETMLALHDLAGPRVRLTVVSPRTDVAVPALRTATAFTRREPPRPSLRDLVARSGAKLVPTVVRRVVADEHLAVLGSGRRLEYDALVLALGARPVPAYGREVVTFGLEDAAEDLPAILADAEDGHVHSIAFVVPPGVAWTLPLYELALQAAHRLREHGAGEVRISLVTPEDAPLALFGSIASAAVADRLERAGVALHLGSYAEVAAPGRLALRPGRRTLWADRVVALPVLEGPAVRGVPTDEHGFLPVDDRGRVRGLDDVWAVGDATSFPIKQGGIACQLADAIAEQLAARAGAGVAPRPFRPVLRAHLVTGEGVDELVAPVCGGAGEGSCTCDVPGAPARKVEGRHLSALLGAEPGFAQAPAAEAEPVA